MTAGEKSALTQLENNVKEAERKLQNFDSPYLRTALQIAKKALKKKRDEIAGKYHGIQKQLL